MFVYSSLWTVPAWLRRLLASKFGGDERLRNFKGVQQQLELVVVRTDAHERLGRLWITAFSESQTWLHNSPGIHSITCNAVDSICMDSTESVFVTNVCEEFHNLFATRLRELVENKDHINAKPNWKFRFYKVRQVTFAMRVKIEADLIRLRQLDVIKPIQTAG